LETRIPPGGGIILALAVCAPFWLGVAACAWPVRTMVYPSGRIIVRGDQKFVDTACGSRGKSGCASKSRRAIIILDSCEGAESLPWAFGILEGVKDQKESEFNW
jgi:hypothetical protein